MDFSYIFSVPLKKSVQWLTQKIKASAKWMNKKKKKKNLCDLHKNVISQK